MSILFEKTNIKGMVLKNRFVRSATHEGMADENGFPTQDLFKLFLEDLLLPGFYVVIKTHCDHFFSGPPLSISARMPGMQSHCSRIR